MANMKRDVEHLQSDLHSLRADIGAMMEKMRQQGIDVANEAQRRGEEFAEGVKGGNKGRFWQRRPGAHAGSVKIRGYDLGKTWHDVRERSAHGYETAEQAVRDKPAISVIAAFGLGMVVGRVLRR